ncbi:hypothetical protein LF1_20250 [Rubripirellula obstinata]|uniref:Uncharacterized protein n=1 Tax=Rubripirellula obstinata TaxID=406547 RepID=A0A5B1CH03_9BACT|nr:hypothetical protein LF1_20250 [Rubripirellula obstinata]
MWFTTKNFWAEDRFLRNGHEITSMFGNICRSMARQANAMKYAYNCLTAWASPNAVKGFMQPCCYQFAVAFRVLLSRWGGLRVV